MRASETLPIGSTEVETGAWIEVGSPYDGTIVGRVAEGGAEQARAALDVAAAALKEPFPAHERAAVLDRAVLALESSAERFAQTICGEAGKPITTARAEVERAISTFRFSAVEARKLSGEMVPMDAAPHGEGKLAFTLREPIGIVGAITPFNFPLNLVAHKVGPAIAAGCPVVLKPAAKTPLSALLLTRLLRECGLPPARLSVVAGPAGEIGDALIADRRVRLLTFTGSAAVGWGLAERGARKRVKLELGNAAPVIVAADADLEAAAAKIAANAFSYAGQSCISIQRVFADRQVYDRLAELIVPAVEALGVGDPASEDTDVGPVIDEGNRDRILEWISEAGGEVLTGGAADTDGIIAPTVIGEPDPGARVQREEVFGPVCTLTATDSAERALELANATDLGLQASIFTADYRLALRAARELDFGAVLVNEAPTFRTDQMPYGGVKDSGNAKEGPAWAVADMTEKRLVVLQL